MTLKRPPDVDAVVIPTAPSPSLPTVTTTEDEIVTLSLPKKPRIRFEREEVRGNPDVLAGASDLRNRLASFLPSLKAADEELQREKLLGRIMDRRIEIDDSSDSSDTSSDGEDDDDEEEQSAPNTMTEVLITSLLGQEEGAQPSKKKKRNKQAYIEMNLGLGVLEEIPPPAPNDKESNERMELIDRIYELRRLQEERSRAEEEEEQVDEMVISDPKKKIMIEELE
ncbi:hypothetical protein TWF481_004142 [Arthrobotrys musiformis]|uniref:Uncharacterized protein n=1 Tax=Arthrobotrys musiformis TaxID=47236 RepID=A0AAV9WKQ3_9PEZI